ncbi:MAG: DUF3105 domain-containing protein [Chloroflexi bacterium]|nr:DUF3105 domain-containing protein [Chloroflexota bacterium]
MPAVVVGAILALIVVGRLTGFISFDSGAAAKIDIDDPAYAPPVGDLGVKVESEGNAHVPDNQRVTYKTNPPASGSHWGSPAPWGSYDSLQPNERTVHNLEHGGIVIHYNGLSQAETDTVKGIVSKLRADRFRKIILQPNPTMTDAKIALAAWLHLLKLETVDDVKMIQFVRKYYDGPDAPEPGVG